MDDKIEKVDHLLKRLAYLTALIKGDRMVFKDGGFKKICPDFEEQIFAKYPHIEKNIEDAIKTRHDFVLAGD